MTQLELKPHPKLNIIEGHNGSGKSSLLEAIYFLTQGRSFRSTQLNRLVSHGQTAFSLFAELELAQGRSVLGVSRDLHGDAKIRLDGANLPSHLEVMKRVPVVLFNPEQFSLLASSTKARRQLLDWGVFYTQSAFLKVWQDLRKALKQRNAALKQKAAPALVKLWDPLIVEASHHIDQYRAQYVNSVVTELQAMIGDFLDTHSVQLQYYRGWSKEHDLTEVLHKSFDQDRVIGHTQHGPQRADLRVKVDHLPASEVLSRGQQKLLISALKIGQGLLLQQQYPAKMIYLLDDIASEFDQTHAARIFQYLQQLDAQVFITAVDARQLPLPTQAAEYGLWSLG